MSSGDELAFEAFVLAEGPALVAFARRLTLDHHRGEDIVQDVLARVGISWTRVSRVDDVRAYVFKAVINETLSWRRRRWSREVAGADLDVAGQVPGVDHEVVVRDELRGALEALPAVQRAVLVLRHHHDLADSEIADLIGCRESTVRSHARRALAALRTVPTSERSTR